MYERGRIDCLDVRFDAGSGHPTTIQKWDIRDAIAEVLHGMGFGVSRVDVKSLSNEDAVRTEPCMCFPGTFEVGGMRIERVIFGVPVTFEIRECAWELQERVSERDWLCVRRGVCLIKAGKCGHVRQDECGLYTPGRDMCLRCGEREQDPSLYITDYEGYCNHCATELIATDTDDYGDCVIEVLP